MPAAIISHCFGAKQVADAVGGTLEASCTSPPGQGRSARPALGIGLRGIELERMGFADQLGTALVLAGDLSTSIPGESK